jgi:hypothetical protein
MGITSYRCRKHDCHAGQRRHFDPTGHAYMSDEARTPAPSAWAVTGVQTAPSADGRSRVEVLVRGRVTGAVDRGSGSDQLRVAVWDDGQEKDFKIVNIPLGQTLVVDVRLGFDGHFAIVADGIGITVTEGSDAGGAHVFHLDPFVPVQR